jgi:hypothetical protein
MIASKSVFDLLQPFTVQAGTSFGTGETRFPGFPQLQAAINEYGHILDHLGLASTPVVVKFVESSGAVQAARAQMSKATGEAEMARAVLNARLGAIETVLESAGFDRDQRQEIIRSILPSLLLGDQGGFAAALAQFGIAGNVVAQANAAARGGGGQGGGRGGGNTP